MIRTIRSSDAHCYLVKTGVVYPGHLRPFPMAQFLKKN
jgi:hypothetical protein